MPSCMWFACLQVTGSPAPKSKAAAALSGPAGMGARPEPLAPALSGVGAVHEDYATFPALDPKVGKCTQREERYLHGNRGLTSAQARFLGSRFPVCMHTGHYRYRL